MASTTSANRVDVPPGGRRRRLEGGRARVVKVRLAEAEFDGLAARAQAAGVSVQRLLVEAGLADGGPTPAERRALWTTLLAARRQLAGLATNVNQLAKVANSTGRVPAGTAAALARIAAIDDRLTRRRAAWSSDRQNRTGGGHGRPGAVPVRARSPRRAPGQRVIGASVGVDVPIGTPLDAATRCQLAAQLDTPRLVHGTEVTRTVERSAGDTLVRAKVAAHVWHLSLSTPAGDRPLSDDEWAGVVQDAMRELGFDDGVKAPAPWVAVHHGRSSAGNDHVHVAVCLVREDGTKASV